MTNTDFNHPYRNNCEADKFYISALTKLPAYIKLREFIINGMKGLNPRIKEETIDDAFKYMVDTEKAKLYNHILEDKKRQNITNVLEFYYRLIKGLLKSKLKVEV